HKNDPVTQRKPSAGSHRAKGAKGAKGAKAGAGYAHLPVKRSSPDGTAQAGYSVASTKPMAAPRPHEPPPRAVQFEKMRAGAGPHDLQSGQRHAASRRCGVPSGEVPSGEAPQLSTMGPSSPA